MCHVSNRKKCLDVEKKYWAKKFNPFLAKKAKSLMHASEVKEQNVQ